MWTRRRTDEDFAAEIEAHLDLETERLVAEGWRPDEARAAALRRFGNVTRARERFHESGRLLWLDQAWMDLRAGLRSVARYPVAALVAVVSLAGGIGAATTTLALRDSLYYLPPPLYARPAELTVLRVDTPDRTAAPVPAAIYRLWADHLGGQAALAAATTGRLVDVTLPDRVEAAAVRGATVNLFRDLGVSPALGVAFHQHAGRAGDPPPVMIGYRQWQQFFGARSDAVGQSISINGAAHIVIGVLPQAFWYTQLGEPVWTLADVHALPPEAPLLPMARRSPATSIAALQSELQSLAQAHLATLPDDRREQRVRASPMVGTPIGEAMGPMPGFLVSAAVLFTLLIACTNVSVLMMAQWTAREHELAIRASIGASRGRLVRTLVTESLLIATAGGALGVLVTLALRGWIVRSGGEFAAFNLTIQPRVFLIAAAITVAAGLLTGMLPALHEARRSVRHPMAGLRVSDRVRQRWRHALVAFEIATTVGLLVVVGALVSAAERSTSGHLGYELPPLMSMRVQSGTGVDVDRVLAGIQAYPGVAAAVAATALPMGPAGPRVRVAGTETGAVDRELHTSSVGPGFLATLGVPLQAGRDFEPGEFGSAARVALVSQAAAGVLWPGLSPIGRTLRIGDEPHDVVGVFADYADAPLQRPEPRVLLPLATGPAAEMQFLIRAAGPAASLRDGVRREVQRLFPGVVVSRASALQDVATVGAQEILVTAVPLMPLVAIAMLLAAAGIYGVLAFAVARRSRELAVRMAVGATRSQVMWTAVAPSLRVVAVGLAGGVGTAMVLTRLAQGSGGIFDSPGAAAFLVPLAIVNLVAILATWVPARRAMRIEPALLLRLGDG